MGNNATVVVMLDACSSIEKDPDFGKKLSRAVQDAYCTPGKLVDISAGGHVNAATVIEAHHADTLVPVLVGANCGQVIDVYMHWSGTAEENEMELLERLAAKHGYTLRRKSKPAEPSKEWSMTTDQIRPGMRNKKA